MTEAAATAASRRIRRARVGPGTVTNGPGLVRFSAKVGPGAVTNGPGLNNAA